MDHVAHLDGRLAELGKALEMLAGSEHIERLVPIIRRPGWTTPAELAFFDAIVSSVVSQAQHVQGLLNALVSAAEKVELNPQPIPPGKSSEALAEARV